jgi:NAD(P)-dependent dehydrogenase (short-subunit alcohol dehydrogenase family)
VDGGAIDRLGGAIYERFGRLDVWVQAAATLGAEGLSPVSHADPRQFAKVERTNFTAVYRLIRSLEPLLKASDAGRVIHLTTSLATTPRAFWGAYASTKAGAETLMKCWADEIESMPIRVAILDPGRMRTQMRAQAYPGEDPQDNPPPSDIGPLIVELARPDLTPPLEVKFRDWKAGPGASALV